ncbi:uncharacterized protein [Triticum aestivum]|uniref:uncharacterized protein n=1 Tax=Triticum aestivum TaxID=4565 RepID=UPI001D01799A|nr:uncharacterized protein LOC123068394 [Triticum aestivum]
MVAVFLAGSERDGAAMQTMPGAMTTISGQIRSRRRGRGRILLGGWRGGDLRGAGGGPAAGLELQRPPFRWTGLPTSPATPRRPTGPPPPRPRPARPLGAPGRTRGFTCGGAGDHCPLGEETAAKATARAPVTTCKGLALPLGMSFAAVLAQGEESNEAEARPKFRLVVPNSSCGGIIGKEGATIKSFIEASATHKTREVKPSSILYLSRCCVQPAACLLCCLKEGSGALDVEDGDKEK